MSIYTSMFFLVFLFIQTQYFSLLETQWAMFRWSVLCDKGVFISFDYDVMMLGRQGHLQWFETDDGDALVLC